MNTCAVSLSSRRAAYRPPVCKYIFWNIFSKKHLTNAIAQIIMVATLLLTLWEHTEK